MLLEDMKTAFRFGQLTGAMLVFYSIAFAQTSMGDLNPACKAAQAVNDVWGLIQVVLVAIVVVGLLLGSGFSFIEKKGGWALALIFASFVLGTVLWVVLGAAGDKISNYATSCTAATATSP